jgi:DNA polymerase III gamma/tau subunit
LLLPPINTEALDPESGEPIPGSSAPRLLPKNSLVPDDNPNKGVSKVALLKYSNEYIGRLHAKIDRRNDYIDLLKEAVRSTRLQAGLPSDEHIQDLLEYAFEDEEEDDEPPTGVTAAAAKAEAQRMMEEDHSITQDISRESSPQVVKSGRNAKPALTRKQSTSRRKNGGEGATPSPALRAHNPKTTSQQEDHIDVEMK